jgi:hypothetical protein
MQFEQWKVSNGPMKQPDPLKQGHLEVQEGNLNMKE